MARVRRRRGTIVLTMSADESELLRSLLGEITDLLESRAAEASAGGSGGEAEVEGSPADPLVAMTGMGAAGTTAPTDAALARLLPDGYRDDDGAAGELRRLSEADIIGQKAAAASVVRATLPAAGGDIRLSAGDADAWAAALNDIRLVLGTRLDVTEDGDPMGGHAPEDPAAAPYLVYHWLTAIQDGLITALL